MLLALGLFVVATAMEQMEGQMILRQIQRDSREQIKRNMEEYNRVKREEDERMRPYREGKLPERYRNI